ncbi:hypothetical protein RD792_006850 [Penstemon davidsonii]|uniref:Uncharacterized protein n=1 Tax=Penstemon davidsonii TaxID=160366 RepID=A0ABR0DC32_9LAMI|nr:hypothetical protein RD792_006850 [Penstemon davidsonii]
MWADPNRIRDPVGNFRWVHAMKWVGQKKFGSVPLAPFVVDGVKKGCHQQQTQLNQSTNQSTLKSAQRLSGSPASAASVSQSALPIP